jgi:hypothetical protein
MRCSHLSNGSEWERRIALHAGGDLRPDEAAEMERGLAECSECAAIAEGYRAQGRVLATAHDETIAPASYAAVRARVLAELERGRRRTWQWVWVGAAAAAVVIAFALSPRGVRAPERGDQTAVSGVAPRVDVPGDTASAGVSREPRRSPAEAGDGTLKRAPQLRGAAAQNRAVVTPERRVEEATQIAGSPIGPGGEAAGKAPLPDGRRASPDVVEAKKEPLAITLYTDDPDVVIYWISDEEGESQ